MSQLRTSNRRRAAAVLAGVVTTVSILLVASSPGAGADPGPRARLRAATAKYHSVKQARRDGFIPTDDCVELPGVGGMGYHFVNPERLAEGVDPDRPQILLYAKGKNGKLRLAGVEWLAPDPDQDLSTDEGRPTLFGQEFDGPMPGHGPNMPVHFDLHAWVWQDNPNGMFEAWNPRVSCR